MDELRFDGKVAIITGAGGNPGLGRSYALFLAARGAKVVVNDFGVGPDGRGAIGAGVDAVVEEIRAAGGEAVEDRHSVAERDEAAAIVRLALDTWGKADILINNAGIAPFARFDQITDRDIERVIGVHLMGHIWMCRAVWPHMVEQQYGRIVQVSSNVAIFGRPSQSIYAASKLGIVGLTRGLAGEGLASGIKVNAIMPIADTLAWQTMLGPEFSERARAMSRVPAPVAPVAAWLAHERCRVSGKILQTEAGAMSEVFFSETAWTDRDVDLTIEDVDRRMAEVLDRSNPEAIPDPDGKLAAALEPKPYTDSPRV